MDTPTLVSEASAPATPISKGFRVYLWVSALLAAGYGACYLFFAGPFLALVKWPFHDPPMAGLFGCTLLSLMVGAMLCLRAKTWQEIKLFVEFVIAWFGFVSVYDVYSIFGVPFPPAALPNVYVDTVINASMCMGFVIFHRRHQNAAARER